jgi:hypothetical protein
MEAEMTYRSCTVVILKESLSREIRDGGIVLVDRRNENMLSICPSRPGQRIAPAVVGIVTYFAPVYRDQNDGSGESPSLQYEPDGLKPVIDCPRRRNSTPHAGMAKGRRDVR